MTLSLGNALIGQAGGPTCVINQSLVGVVEACLAEPRVARVLGALHGIQGLMERRVVDLGRESAQALEAVAATPGAALGSVRLKPDRAQCEQALEALRALDVRYFFYIGGNDTAETAELLGRVADEAGYELHLIHVPKTIDNDLVETDHCPGYGSAARFVASAVIGDNHDNRSLQGVKINVIMGRHAGWLTAASALARVHPGDGPHVICLPERPFHLEPFLREVEQVHADHGRCLVCVSEGIAGPDGEPIQATGERDTHGNVQLSGTGFLGDWLADNVRRRLGGARVRADTFGYLQRNFAGCVSAVDAAEAREVGRRAVDFAVRRGVRRATIVLRREPGGEYRVTYDAVPLERVAGKTRVLEPALLRGDFDVSEAFLEYALPLLGELPRTGLLEALPAGA